MNLILIATAVMLLVPVVVLCVECLAALLPGRRRSKATARRPRLAIIIPAHNEECVLSATLASVCPQLHTGDRVIVVADNCDDATTAIGHRFGAEVIERVDVRRRGKGYALDFGIRHLESDAPDIVVMMDADCHVHDGAIDALVAQVVETGKPAQAVYLLERPSRPGPKDLVSALAFMVKNLVRPSGLGRLGLPCLLTGTGMAFPWPVIRGAKLATGNIVEDLQLGLDLAIEGHAPFFCAAAKVTGKLPEQRRAAISQRRRWEHGHLQTLFTQVPRLIRSAVRTRSVPSLALALELAVPPLSLLVLIYLAALGGMAEAAWHGGATWVAPIILASGAGVAGICIAAVWLKFGRQQLPLTSLLAAPFYVAWKIPLYLAFFVKPQKEWVRTERTLADAFHEGDLPPGADEAFPAMQQPSVVDLCGVNIHALSEQQCIHRILRYSAAGRGGVVVTPNLDHLRRCRDDAEFARLVSRADLVVADGMPLIWASRLQGTPLPGRVAGSDLISSLSASAAQTGKKLFLLGGDPGTADAAATILRQRYPGLNVAGTHCPPMGFEKNAEQMRQLTEAVLTALPDIIFVALGSPKQERLIERLRVRLPGAWWLGVGISFSFLAGEVKRAPRWMRAMGLEWVHRLVQEPGRLFKRYLVQGVPFAVALLGASTWRGIIRRLGFRRTEPALTVRIDSGVGSIAVRVTESDLVGAPAGAAKGASDAAYRSFLAGFATEIWDRGGDDEKTVGVSARPALATRLGALETTTTTTPTPTKTGPTELPAMLKRVRAVVLVAGPAKPTKLTAAIDRSVLDLPLEDGRSILNHWSEQTALLGRLTGGAPLALRLMIDPASAEPIAPPADGDVRVRIERDRLHRGTGGVLRDIAADYTDDDVLVVATAPQALLSPLADLARALAELEGDLNLISHADGSPSGLMLIRCAALRGVSSVGCVDLREEALPAIAREWKVNYLYQTQASGLPVRTHEEYITALQRRHRLSLAGAASSSTPGVGGGGGESCEEDRTPFAIAEKGAAIDPRARVLDSVVLGGAVVAAGATVVRSIVCPGGTLAAGETAIDSLVMNAEVATR